MDLHGGPTTPIAQQALQGFVVCDLGLNLQEIPRPCIPVMVSAAKSLQANEMLVETVSKEMCVHLNFREAPCLCRCL